MSSPPRPRFHDGDHVKLVAIYLRDEAGQAITDGIVIGRRWEDLYSRWAYHLLHIDDGEVAPWTGWYPEKALAPMP